MRKNTVIIPIIVALAGGAVLRAAGLGGLVRRLADDARGPRRHNRHHRRAAPEPGDVGTGLVDIPADLVNDPQAPEYVIDSLLPGVVVYRRVDVANYPAPEVT